MVKTLPFTHTLCGDLTYSSTFMTQAITDLAPFDDVMVDPVGYDSVALEHSVYSEDFGLLGLQPYTVTAAFSEYLTITSTASATIEFLDPCPKPE